MFKKCSARDGCKNPLKNEDGLLHVSRFDKSSSQKDGFHYTCKYCKTRMTLKSRLKNKAKYNAYVNNYIKIRAKKDASFKILIRLRNKLSETIHNKRLNKNFSSFELLGMSVEEFMLYFETKLKPGMSWENWGKNTWHIDHIKPLSSFDLTNQEELKKAFNYTNLQPLWAKDNLSKSNKIDWKKAVFV